MLTSLQKYSYPISFNSPRCWRLILIDNSEQNIKPLLRIPKPISNTIIDITPSVVLECFCILRCSAFCWNGIRSLITVAKNTNKYFRRVPFNPRSFRLITRAGATSLVSLPHISSYYFWLEDKSVSFSLLIFIISFIGNYKKKFHLYEPYLSVVLTFSSSTTFRESNISLVLSKCDKCKCRLNKRLSS